MTQDEIIEMARQACPYTSQSLRGAFYDGFVKASKLVAAKATEEANARANSSWTLMCKKMVEAERDACAKIADNAMGRLTDDAWCAARMIKQEIKARGEA
jgi:hypothetical protein